MDRSGQFCDGAAWATKRAIQWLHNRADKMNDPHAKHLLHSAATNMGWDLRSGQAFVGSPAPATPPTASEKG